MSIQFGVCSENEDPSVDNSVIVKDTSEPSGGYAKYFKK